MEHRSRSIAAGALPAVAAAALSLALFASTPCSLAAPSAGANAPAALPDNPILDARLKDYLQKRFMLMDPNMIRLGPMVVTPMAGIYERAVQVSNDKGQTVNAQMFTNAEASQIILGQMFDLTNDPWNRVDLRPLHLDDRPTLGPANAPVTVIEFADFECPFCAHAFAALETMVKSTYKDQIRVIFKNYPLNVHPWAQRAAAAAECGRLQNPDAFWEFARDFYQQQGSITPKNIDDHIRQTAKRLNLDVPTLEACVNGTHAKERIAQDQKDGQAVGVASTPTFFVGGVRVEGMPDERTFSWLLARQIDRASAKP